MSRRGNYGFERRRKEALRRSRQDAKRERKAERTSQGATGPEMGEAAEVGAPAGLWEWFSPARGRVVTTEPKVRPEEGTPDDWVLLTEADRDPTEGT